MAVDANLALQAKVTKTATFHGTGVSLAGVGTPKRGLWAHVIFTDAGVASGTETVQFVVDHSDDNTTFYQLTDNAELTVEIDTTAEGELYIPFNTEKPYVRLSAIFTDTGSGTTPTITYFADIVLDHP